MPDYKQGKIYQIWSPQTDRVYIGSTTQPLHKRLDDHKSNIRTNSKICSAVEIIKLGDAKIELIEEYPCENRQQLTRREGQIIRDHKDTSVNVVIPGRTDKEYYEDNREKRAVWYVANREKRAEQNKVWYVANREKRAEQKKVWYATKRDHINQQRRERNASKRAAAPVTEAVTEAAVVDPEG